MFIISKDGPGGRDPNRVKKEEFLHKLHKTHSSSPRKLDLDLDEMAAAQMYSSKALAREGVTNMTVEERIDLINEMTHAIGATTNLAQQQMKEALEREKRSKLLGAHVRRKEAAMRAMLERKK